jgi:peptide/nickel transport system substrate-binding protein
MKRRRFLLNTAAIISTASLVRPGILRAASASTLKFVPYADLAVLDPLGSAFVTRNHLMMVFDTLFAIDATGDAQPQMLAGYTVEDGEKTWKLTLRDGLLFHDGSKVLSRDVVSGVRRWAVRDAFGQAMMF